MDRRPNNQKRFEEAARRLFQRGAGNNEPDITRYVVQINNKPFFIGERTNEIEDGKTIATYKAQLDDQGAPFSHIKEFILCSCGCRLNINSRIQKIARCIFCQRTVCQLHSTRWKSMGIDITFCKDKKCRIKGKLLQLGFYTAQSLKFSLSIIFGFEYHPHRNSLTVNCGDEEREEDKIEEYDKERMLNRLRGRYWENK